MYGRYLIIVSQNFLKKKKKKVRIPENITEEYFTIERYILLSLF